MAASNREKLLLTIDELSQVSGLSVATLRRYVQKGKIKALQPGGPGCKLLFRPDALDQAGNSQLTAHPKFPSPARPDCPAPAPDGCL